MAEKKLPKPVRVEGAAFNKEHWAGKTQTEFMEANANVYAKRYKGMEDAEARAKANLEQAWKMIAPAAGEESARQNSGTADANKGGNKAK